MKFNKIYDNIKNFIKCNWFEIILLAFISFASFYNFDYLVYKPGGAIDIGKRVSVSNKEDINGSYSLSYVAVSNGNLLNIMGSYLVKDWDLVKKEEVTYKSVDYDTTLKIEKLDYQSSIDDATIVAFTKAGKKIDIKSENIYVLAIDENAKTDIQLLDNVLKINNKKFKTSSEVRDYIQTLNKGDKVILEVKDKDNDYKERYAYIYELDGMKIMGVGLFIDYDFESTPEITINSDNKEAGSSGGLMLSLAIYDLISDIDLAKGKMIQGTGTIDIEGNVGQIGGIKYKLLGAKRNKADIFFVPEDNYEEAKKVYKKYNMKFDLVKVKNIDDAIKYLNDIK